MKNFKTNIAVLICIYSSTIIVIDNLAIVQDKTVYIGLLISAVLLTINLVRKDKLLKNEIVDHWIISVISVVFGTAIAFLTYPFSLIDKAIYSVPNILWIFSFFTLLEPGYKRRGK